MVALVPLFRVQPKRYEGPHCRWGEHQATNRQFEVVAAKRPLATVSECLGLWVTCPTNTTERRMSGVAESLFMSHCTI